VADQTGPKHPYPSDVALWRENDEPILLQAVFGNLAELTSRGARALAHALIELADLSDVMQGAVSSTTGQNASVAVPGTWDDTAIPVNGRNRY
jgi:hypothetical protein